MVAKSTLCGGKSTLFKKGWQNQQWQNQQWQNHIQSYLVPGICFISVYTMQYIRYNLLILFKKMKNSLRIK